MEQPSSRHQKGGRHSMDFQLRHLVQQEMRRREANLLSNETLSFIPEARNVFSKRQSTICQFFWLVFVVCSAIICIYQIYQRINDYYDYPIKSKIKLASPEKIMFPAITICPRFNENILNLTSKKSPAAMFMKCFERLWEFVSEDIKVENVWEVSDSREEFNITLYKHQGLPSNIPIETEKVYSFFGVCMLIKIKEEIYYEGRETMLRVVRKPQISTCNFAGLIISIHNPEDSLSAKTALYTTEGSYTSIAIKYSQFDRLSTPNRKCISAQEAEICLNNCVKDQVNNLEISCKLPFVPFTKLPYCRDFEDKKDTHKKVWKKLLETDRLSVCKCKQICSEKIFTSIRIAIRLDGNSSELDFFYPNNNFYFIKEEYAYDLISLICDIGGNLGLYLGLSLISFFELFEHFSSIFMQKRIKHKM